MLLLLIIVCGVTLSGGDTKEIATVLAIVFISFVNGLAEGLDENGGNDDE